MQYINKINHITLSVRDLKKSIDFYIQVLTFILIAQWEAGAYLQAGDIWLCLTLENNFDNSIKQEYSHIAFNVDAQLFIEFIERIKSYHTNEWKKNNSEGDSLYILDPDNHKLEIHSGDIFTRIASCKAKPYKNMRFITNPK